MTRGVGLLGRGIALAVLCGISAFALADTSFPELPKTPVNQLVAVGKPLGKSFQAAFQGHRYTPGAASKQLTEFYAAAAPDGLEIYVRCTVDAKEKVKANTSGEQRDRSAMVKEDDFVEIVIDPNHDGEKAFAIAVNPRGAVYDGIYYALDYVDSAWDSQVQPKVEVGEGMWSVSMTVPYKALDLFPAPGDVIGLGCLRASRSGEKESVSAWPSGQTYYSWSVRRLIPEPFSLASVVIPGQKGPVRITSTTRGRLSRDPQELNRFAAVAVNTDTTNRTIRFEYRVGDAPSAAIQGSYVLQPGQTQVLTLPYQWSGPLSFIIRDTANNAVLYESRARRSFDVPKRIHDLGGSYDPGMVTKVAPVLPESAHAAYPMMLLDRPIDRQLGLVHPLDRTIADLVKNNVMIFARVRIDDNPYNNLAERGGLFRKHGLKVVFIPDPNVAVNARPGGLLKCDYLVNISGAAKPTAYQLRPLPVAQYKKDFFTALDEGVRKYRDLIRIIALPDELDYHINGGLAAAWSSVDNRRKYPAVVEIDKDIRERFGFGRYGLAGPETPPADVPFCKMATARWLNEWVAEFNSEVVRHVKAIDPAMLVMSDDPQGLVFPYDYGKRWRDVDIAVHQSTDKAIPNDLGTAVITKAVADMSGAKNFWPCSHIEGDIATLRLNELREVLSRAFRNGATGIMTYPLVSGRFSLWPDFGAPEQWAYVHQVAEFYRQGHRAKRPESVKVAALYSSYTAMMHGSRGVGAVYNLLGPGSGGYFEYVDDLAVERGDVDLGKYSVVFIYCGPYESRTVVEKLETAVRAQGVTLVIAAPDACRTAPDGKPITEGRALFAGVQSGDAIGNIAVVPGPQAPEAFKRMKPVTVQGARPLQVDKETQVWLNYSNGKPACAMRPLGKGRVIHFGFNPFWDMPEKLDPNAPTLFDFGPQAVSDPLLVPLGRAESFFKMLLTQLQVNTDEAIWKAKLPEPQWSMDWPQDACLTGNAIVWQSFRPRTPVNLPAVGGYRYSLPPQGEKPLAKDAWIPLSEGTLTDRIQALRTAKEPANAVAAWKDPQALEIEFDLGYQAQVTRVNVYARGACPNIRLLGSSDGNKWEVLSRVAGKELAAVDCISLPVEAPAMVRRVKLECGQRPAKTEFEISEVELWGNPSPGVMSSHE